MTDENQKIAFSGKRRVTRVGGSRMIALPAEWLEQHDIEEGDDLQFIANRDLKFVAPEGQPDIYRKVAAIVHEEE